VRIPEPLPLDTAPQGLARAHHSGPLSHGENGFHPKYVPNGAICFNTPKNSEIEKIGVSICIVGRCSVEARKIMTYQSHIIKQVLQSHLRRRGIHIPDESLLNEMIEKNIRRLNAGENIAVDFDWSGEIKSIRKVHGFDCLHSIEDNAIMISFQELERYFNEQQSVSVQFPE